MIALIDYWETTKHKLWVMWYIIKACVALLKRAIVHDLSKYSKYEAPYFRQAALQKKLVDVEYGSDEYKQRIKELLGPALKHHYENNSHHPEYYGYEWESMPPLDQIEMLCDWRAATRRHKTGDMVKSFAINARRFNISFLHLDALRKDAREIGLIK